MITNEYLTNFNEKVFDVIGLLFHQFWNSFTALCNNICTMIACVVLPRNPILQNRTTVGAKKQFFFVLHFLSEVSLQPPTSSLRRNIYFFEENHFFHFGLN